MLYTILIAHDVPSVEEIEAAAAKQERHTHRIVQDGSNRAWQTETGIQAPHKITRSCCKALCVKLSTAIGGRIPFDAGGLIKLINNATSTKGGKKTVHCTIGRISDIISSSNHPSKVGR